MRPNPLPYYLTTSLSAYLTISLSDYITISLLLQPSPRGLYPHLRWGLGHALPPEKGLEVLSHQIPPIFHYLTFISHYPWSHQRWDIGGIRWDRYPVGSGTVRKARLRSEEISKPLTFFQGVRRGLILYLTISLFRLWRDQVRSGEIENRGREVSRSGDKWQGLVRVTL
jgi:hypothetical protein